MSAYTIAITSHKECDLQLSFEFITLDVEESSVKVVMEMVYEAAAPSCQKAGASSFGLAGQLRVK